MQKIGDRIKSAREKAGRSQREIAAACDVATSLVARWESHGRIPTIEDVLKIAELLGIKPTELLQDVEAFAFKVTDRDTARLVQIFSALDPFFKQKLLEFSHHFARIDEEAKAFDNPMVAEPTRSA